MRVFGEDRVLNWVKHFSLPLAERNIGRLKVLLEHIFGPVALYSEDHDRGFAVTNVNGVWHLSFTVFVPARDQLRVYRELRAYAECQPPALQEVLTTVIVTLETECFEVPRAKLSKQLQAA